MAQQVGYTRYIRSFSAEKVIYLITQYDERYGKNNNNPHAWREYKAIKERVADRISSPYLHRKIKEYANLKHKIENMKSPENFCISDLPSDALNIILFHIVGVKIPEIDEKFLCVSKEFTDAFLYQMQKKRNEELKNNKDFEIYVNGRYTSADIKHLI